MTLSKSSKFRQMEFCREKSLHTATRLRVEVVPGCNPWLGLRMRLGMTLQEMAAEIGIEYVSLEAIERSRRAPSLVMAKRFQAVLREYGVSVTLDDLVAHVVVNPPPCCCPPGLAANVPILDELI